jgi:hypothetical protein
LDRQWEAIGAGRRTEDGAVRAEGGGRRAEERPWVDAGRRAEGAFRGHADGGLVAETGENVTNEPNLCENASTSKVLKSVQVTANFDEVLGLDK